MSDDRKSQLCAIESEISSCVKCELSKTRKNTVSGAGDFKAEVMFIGEAPGQREDEQGIPFCGASGKFLDQMLDSIGLNRDKVFIANTLKCRPPNNRDPEDSEKEACRPYLDKQIELINPKLIVTLGKHATSAMMPGVGGISQNHGKALRRPNGRTYLALYHPAAALHNGGLRETLLEDFSKIPRILEKLDQVKREENKNKEKDNIKQQKLV